MLNQNKSEVFILSAEAQSLGALTGEQVDFIRLLSLNPKPETVVPKVRCLSTIVKIILGQL